MIDTLLKARTEDAVPESIRVPWVPSKYEFIELALDVAKVGKGDVLYDLGCGDGRVAIEAAKRGAKAVCIEINPALIERARENALREGVAHRIEFINENFFNVDLSRATVVYMYLLTSVNKALRPKLETELKSGTRVISLDFEIPGWLPVRVISLVTQSRVGTLYFYIVGMHSESEELLSGAIR